MRKHVLLLLCPFGGITAKASVQAKRSAYSYNRLPGFSYLTPSPRAGRCLAHARDRKLTSILFYQDLTCLSSRLRIYRHRTRTRRPAGGDLMQKPKKRRTAKRPPKNGLWKRYELTSAVSPSGDWTCGILMPLISCAFIILHLTESVKARIVTLPLLLSAAAPERRCAGLFVFARLHAE